VIWVLYVAAAVAAVGYFGYIAYHLREGRSWVRGVGNLAYAVVVFGLAALGLVAAWWLVTQIFDSTVLAAAGCIGVAVAFGWLNDRLNDRAEKKSKEREKDGARL
jgi:hypothetical protein